VVEAKAINEGLNEAFLCGFERFLNIAKYSNNKQSGPWKQMHERFIRLIRGWVV
jgi:hypothetical protein